MTTFSPVLKKISPQQWFLLSTIVVNGGNYLYNLLLGRMLGPEAFAEAALMITLLLVLSFLGMTFQLSVAKFSAQYDDDVKDIIVSKMMGYALWIGGGIGLLVLLAAPKLQAFFNTQNALMFQLFGIGIPVYFLMSVNRGHFQGLEQFAKLSFSYQSEMWGRLLITLTALLLIPAQHGVLVVVGILVSLVLGLFPLKKIKIDLFGSQSLDSQIAKQIRTFIGITAFYELTQILINNSDILLVKRYFDAEQAGLYAALALIGRVVYFVAWMFVMLLLPQVVKAKKRGEKTAPMLFKYVGYISILSLSIVACCLLFPETIVSILFGEQYVSMAGLLWQYALATSLFAIANIFTYYFLSIDKYKPIWFSVFFGLSQVVLIALFHQSLTTVVQVQLIAMLSLLIAQILYFVQHNIKQA